MEATVSQLLLNCPDIVAIIKTLLKNCRIKQTFKKHNITAYILSAKSVNLQLHFSL